MTPQVFVKRPHFFRAHSRRNTFRKPFANLFSRVENNQIRLTSKVSSMNFQCVCVRHISGVLLLPQFVIFLRCFMASHIVSETSNKMMEIVSLTVRKKIVCICAHHN